MIALVRFLLSSTSMRTSLLLTIVAIAACAPRTVTYPTTPVQYVCGDITVIRSGTEIHAGTEVSRLSWSDEAGEHFVTWPLAPTDRQAIEYVVPRDSRQDAVQHRYDTTFGSSTSDWRLVETKPCIPRGGYNDMLARYLRGESIDSLTRDMGLASRDETRAVLRKALVRLQKRYLRDH